jgi:hypothetical protein
MSYDRQASTTVLLVSLVFGVSINTKAPLRTKAFMNGINVCVIVLTKPPLPPTEHRADHQHATQHEYNETQ